MNEAEMIKKILKIIIEDTYAEHLDVIRWLCRKLDEQEAESNGKT